LRSVAIGRCTIYNGALEPLTDGGAATLTHEGMAETIAHASGDARFTATTGASLSPDELARYGRHISLAEIGRAGQERLKAARVLIVGAGGLGSPAGLYLAAAGVGTLGLVDFDEVDRSNLQRQVLYADSDVARRKVVAAAERIRGLNPHVEVEAHETRLTAANAAGIVGEYDLVVDGTDNFATRYLVNDVCVLLGVPNVYGSVLRFEGQAAVFAAAGGPCYRCLFRDPPPPGLVPSCGEAGVMGVLPGIIGSIQATEAIKLITGAGDPLVGRLLLVDALTMSFRTITVRPDPLCPACGTREITLLRDYDEYCAGPTVPAEVSQIEPAELAALLRRQPPPTLIDVREPLEWEIASLPGARLIPLRELESAIASLPRGRELVVYCHHGVRSRTAAEMLAAAGHSAASLAGGIDRWSREIDPSVRRY
jgi:molybdopterin/thiamine biosynthesis adenylyltransferase/rhodanese-related sulfurtransferase